MIDLQRELEDKSTESKINEFDFDFREKLKIEYKGFFQKLNHKITKIKIKIKLNYNPKLQIDDIRQKIRGKTCNLTRESDQNDPINHRIQGFSFRDIENDCGCSRGEFSVIDRRNLTFIISGNER